MSNIPQQHLDLSSRPRRNRRTAAIRGLARETSLDASHLIYPLFVQDGKTEPIDAMPGQNRWSLEGLVEEVKRAYALGINAVVLFPKVPDNQKTETGEHAYYADGLAQRAIAAVKQAVPEVAVITDVALDPYNSDGHDGIVSSTGEVLNDQTIAVLCKQAISHAEAGADIVAPSDMMDGRVGAIRAALDHAGHTNVAIMSYTAKYASAFYGPFRGALDSAPRESTGKPIPKDKATYQMDPANQREALRELELDEAEGADIVMVKPAGPYLDVIAKMREVTTLPIAAYQVSGEYVMIKAAAATSGLDEQALVMETLTGIRGAGADMVLTYFAPQVAQWLS
ncbi:MAG: porphobilinogen synthase [Phycisphaeraceae bacterium]